MLLYDDERAPNPRRVRIFLAEKGLDIPRQQVRIIKGEHRTDAYRKISPNSRVPALQLDDGSILLETVAICRYFESEHPKKPLFGQGSKEQALVEMWQRRMELELFMPLGMAFRHCHPAMADFENQIEAFGKIQHKIGKKGMQTLENRLSESPYLAGENYSIADITAQCALDFFLRLVNETVPEANKATLRWQGVLAERPSAKA